MLNFYCKLFHANLLSDDFGDHTFLCNHRPCVQHGIMKVGDNVSFYIDSRIRNGRSYSWSINLNGVRRNDNPLKWYYTLGVRDVGRLNMTFSAHFADGQDLTFTQHIIVLSGNQWLSVKFEIMSLRHLLKLTREIVVISSNC